MVKVLTLQARDPMWALVLSQAAPLPIQLPVCGLGKQSRTAQSFGTQLWSQTQDQTGGQAQQGGAKHSAGPRAPAIPYTPERPALQHAPPPPPTPAGQMNGIVDHTPLPAPPATHKTPAHANQAAPATMQELSRACGHRATPLPAKVVKATNSLIRELVAMEDTL